MALTQDQLKKQVADAAIEHVKSGIIGVGTGSTANFFIDALGEIKNKIEGAVDPVPTPITPDLTYSIAAFATCFFN